MSDRREPPRQNCQTCWHTRGEHPELFGNSRCIHWIERPRSGDDPRYCKCEEFVAYVEPEKPPLPPVLLVDPEQTTFGPRNPGQSKNPAADYLYHRLKRLGLNPEIDPALKLARKDGWEPPPTVWGFARKREK